MRTLPPLVFGIFLFLASPAAHSQEAEADVQPEPAKADASRAVEMPDPVTRIKKIDGNNYALDDIRFNSETGEIRFPAKVNMVKDQIEYIIVTEIGKTHESLLSTKTSPFILNTVMLLCRYEASAEGLINFVDREGPGGGDAPPEVEKEKEEPAPEGANPFTEEKEGEPSPPPPPAAERKPVNNLIEIFVSYEKEGEKTEVLLDDWIYNTSTKKSLGDKYWVYTGSDVQQGAFLAELEGSITAIYVDKFAMLNNPIKGNDKDDIWEPYADRMPPVNTPLEIIFRPYKAKADEPE